VGPEEVAIYAVAGRIMTEAVTVALYFMNSVLPVLTHSVTTKDGRHGKIIQYSFDFLTMTMIPLIIGGWILAYPMIKIVSEPKYLSRLSENFYGSDAVFQILLIAMFVAFLTTLFSFVLVALNEQKKLLWINLGGILVNLALNSFMIPLYTSRGAAVTSIIAEIFLTITSLLVARRYLKFTISIRNTAKALVAGVIMGVVVYLLRDPSFTLMENKNLLILIPLGIIIYTGFVFLFKAIPQEAIALFRKKATPEQTTEPL
jgi:O-antigen/teichoic acid export membrane protein